jgi:SAM-dependent methyltransferase
MSVTSYRKSLCALCGSADLTTVLRLAPTPPANAFELPDKQGATTTRFPLELGFCGNCSHVQLLDVVDASYLFSDYVYVSGTSPAFVAHFDRLAEHLIDELHLTDGDLVVDIGSNDGTLLSAFKKRGHGVLGIDPARDIAAGATAKGIETWPCFLSDEVAARVLSSRGTAALVTANNVFAHVDDMAGFAANVRGMLAPDGVFVFEVSYLVDVFEKCLFDTIYHEHLSYHSVKPLRTFLASQGMDLFRVERIDTHGGSIRCYAQLAAGSRETDPAVAELEKKEAELGLYSVKGFSEFGERIDTLRDELRNLLTELKGQGCTIAGYGAPAKATTLLYHFGLNEGFLEYVVDDSPLKQGLMLPGTTIPVMSSDEIYKRRPDYLVVLAWNFARNIIDQHPQYRAAGGRFIVPVPNLEIL